MDDAAKYAKKLALLAVLGGCVPKAPVADWSAVPHLPNPYGAVWANDRFVMPDIPVLTLIDSTRASYSLMSAAAAMALAAAEGEGGLTSWEAQEAAWIGGYSGVIAGVEGWSTAVEAPPPGALRTWLADGQGDLGVARARSPRGDVWVALRGTLPADMPVLAKEVPLGAIVELPAVSGRWRAVSPSGVPLEGAQNALLSLHMTERGEWLVERLRDGKREARLALYAGMVAPKTPLLAVIPQSDPAAALWSGAEALREAYGADPLTRLSSMDGLAAELSPDQPLSEQLRGRGVLAPNADALRCDTPTVEDCLALWAFDLDHRAALVQAQRAGLAAEVRDGRLHATWLWAW